MKKISIVLFSISLISSCSFAKPSQKTATYKIQNGDTLFTIARKHHTTIEEVRQSNGMKKGDNLKIGRALKVPTNTYFPDKKSKNTKVATVKKTEKPKVVSAKKSTKSENYKIQSGDTLFTIARKHHTTIEEVRKANSIKKGENLKVGRALKVPTNTYFPDKKKSEAVKLASNAKKEKKAAIQKNTSPRKTASHKVKKGESLYSIAKSNHTTVKKLKKANNIKTNKSLKIGQVLAIPGAAKSPDASVKVAKNSKKVQTKKASSKKIVLEPKPAKKGFLTLVGGSGKQKALPKDAKKHLGKRYVWGATGPYKFDCSGFTSYVCKKNGVCLPRTSIKQSKVGKRVNRSHLKPGDLVFFDTSKRRRGYVNHVGIYIGNNKFIHASSAKKKVVVTSLSKPFYKSRFKWGRRLSM
ncbi:MAG: LysM peptidoglycan-binding domain-containing protein [Campylobacterota bacterium]|nr:LysM peptidoglycan-binding domain-containing protein [Campylobacterota bacterium]